MGLYTWTDRWVDLPQEPLGWMHSGVAATDGCVVVAHPGKPAAGFRSRFGPHGTCAKKVLGQTAVYRPSLSAARASSSSLTRRTTSFAISPINSFEISA